MQKIDVYALVGDTGITLEDGQKLYDKVHPVLRAGNEVELDFMGVGILASPFFNAAIGHLLQDIRPDDLNRLLRVANLSATGNLTLRRVIENAQEYYANQRVHQAVDDTMEELKEEAEAR